MIHIDDAFKAHKKFIEASDILKIDVKDSRGKIYKLEQKLDNGFKFTIIYEQKGVVRNEKVTFKKKECILK